MLKKREIVALSIFVVFYILFGTVVTLKQEALVYLPSNHDFTNCPALAEANQIQFNTTRLYLKPAAQASSPVLVVYHGNAGSACDRAFYATIATQAGYGYAIVEYSGYSNDIATPSHEGVKQTVADTVAYLHEQNINNVIVLGESIGTGAATYHANLHAPGGLILISPFTNLRAVAAHRFWFYPTRLLVDNAFDEVTLLENYHHPLLIIHGTDDTIIPFTLGQKLFAAVSTEKTFVTIPGGNHNDLFTFTETFAALHTFLQTLKSAS